MSASQEVAKMDELAMLGIFDVDGSPTSLSSANSLAINDNVALRSHNSEWDQLPNAFIQGLFLLLIFLTFVRI